MHAPVCHVLGAHGCRFKKSSAQIYSTTNLFYDSGWHLNRGQAVALTLIQNFTQWHTCRTCQNAREKWRREARLLSNLNHNIIIELALTLANYCPQFISQLGNSTHKHNIKWRYCTISIYVTSKLWIATHSTWHYFITMYYYYVV